MSADLLSFPSATLSGEDGQAPVVLGVTCSVTGRQWHWRAGGQASHTDRMGMAIAQQANLPEIVGRMLALRGIAPEQVGTYLTPTLNDLMPNPSTLVDMDAAADRLARAVSSGETVGLFGDYDVDGACSTALLATFLQEQGCTVLTHIPDRMTEGYGPNTPAIAAMQDKGASLIICLDCGTAAVDVLEHAGQRSDIIILDHHQVQGPLPEVVATVNPNRPDCPSRLHGLCAAAVTFMTIVATRRALRAAGWFDTRPMPDLWACMDLVALATVCDVMPLRGLNRAFVTQGLRIMGRRKRVGLAALLEVAGARDPLSAFTCGFAVGPRINAGGRIADSGLGLRLLLCTDPAEARVLAERLNSVNHNRQSVESGILDRAMELAAAQRAQGNAVLVLSGRDWHPGVVGIVAGRIKEKFNRPVLVGAEMEDGSVKGSARSVPGQDLGGAIIAARQAGLLSTGGGHAMAAGFGLPAAGVPALQEFLNHHLATAADLPDAVDLTIDAVVNVAAATVELAADMDRLAPFGTGNDEPLIALPRVRVAYAERIGSEGNTLRLTLEGEGRGPRLKALVFRANESPLATVLEDRDGPPLHLAGWLRAESWKGRTSATFFIRDVAVAQ
ncbi:single-stranded-DNA-specific exonuclease RecJ [Komagataeibacter rhaeticus]|uniref:Single-stranded-DNA-specific exonuclease RecJ n=1 Tax=Komagataeibacter rhaeticus TaxID=215221 RepID=A0A181CD73_9PROT|nr:single-stranded-DNA-specific exonuclease RecJ [Komagataeibacter rhaeticus]ATU71738.1 single-stranded-DNA-specific exonuclease RecJ [Komagataeibacter xylinus]QIP36185.1 single-stranded-DNA-specific exonuclease RecJ [Komagataeibacter rhaeticus]QOC45944.1 single-stranded-DNA-specific exonuclease RecJ [Komagataeibacter rhaeticus]WPP21452.1 single-stranded-DNA-specific exonuclease RecJ [Komagataeibacter rhaeticus]SAY49510.1 Single-stranded-DNA-specific exonuclease RecJ [Komagataeibacter rhaeticu